VTMKLYVCNLPYSVNEDQLRTLFTQVGEITSVTMITDRYRCCWRIEIKPQLSEQRQKRE
jgi:RNA recognition motif-containing protein